MDMTLPTKETRTYGAMTAGLLELMDWLVDAGCTHVAIRLSAVREGGVMSEGNIIARTPIPGTVASLTADLRRLGVEPGMALLVHSSLSALGWVCGGPVAVVQALMDALRDAEAVTYPSHRGDSREYRRTTCLSRAGARAALPRWPCRPW